MIWMVKAEFIRPSTGARTGRAPPLAPWALERSSGRPWVQVRASKQSDEPQRDRAACGGAGAPRQTQTRSEGSTVPLVWRCGPERRRGRWLPGQQLPVRGFSLCDAETPPEAKPRLLRKKLLRGFSVWLYKPFIP